MLFWIVLSATVLVAGLWVARPFLSKGAIEMNDADGAISVFRDQMDEVDRDLASGLISAEERDQALREIERRALHAAKGIDAGFSVSRRSLPAVAAIVATAGAVAFGGYLIVGKPDQPDQPLAQRKTEMLERRAAAGDINSRIQLLIDRTSENPDSFDDWWTLAVSYASLGDHASAVEAYRKASELGGDRPGVLSAYAESMTLANGNKVPDAARLIFEQVLNRGPDTRARYYIALSKAQSQNFEAALNDWAALANESAPDAPWLPLVRRDIVNMVRFLKLDVTDYLPDASGEEIAKSGGTAPQLDAAQRVAQLEQALSADAHDYKGWIELATLQAQAGNDDAAAAALDSARDAYAAAPFVLQKLDDTARSLGLDMIASGLSGPTTEDMAAAAELSETERNDMIDGMVAGLAAKLEENPNNPDGWIMLVRSYAVLGEAAKARKYFTDATQHFAGNQTVLARLNAEAGPLLTK